MARKPENTFVLSVHRHLPKPSALHREKTNNPYRSGMADWWYSGIAADLWVEYKFIPRLPVRGTTTVTPDLSEQQLDWLRGRYNEGRNVAVIVGCPEGAVVYTDLLWEQPMTTDEFRRRLLSRLDTANWIAAQTLGA